MSNRHKYLFILSPPYCGSTLLNQLVSSSSSVSVNNPLGSREGQTLPIVRSIMFDHNRRWDKNLDFDWGFIKKEWEKHWDLNCPILLEKSPPNIIRAKSIERHFVNSYFVIFHRNPYAHCESLIRRNNTKAIDAAKFAIQCLTSQKGNILELNNKVQISYETLTNNVNLVAEILSRFIPELKGIDLEKKFTAHNYLNKKMKITNLNHDKLTKLTEIQFEEINSVFRQNKEILDFFEYELIENVSTKI